MFSNLSLNPGLKSCPITSGKKHSNFLPSFHRPTHAPSPHLFCKERKTRKMAISTYDSQTIRSNIIPKIHILTSSFDGHLLIIIPTSLQLSDARSRTDFPSCSPLLIMWSHHPPKHPCLTPSFYLSVLPQQILLRVYPLFRSTAITLPYDLSLKGYYILSYKDSSVPSFYSH